jgi:hypothetical protein
MRARTKLLAAVVTVGLASVAGAYTWAAFVATTNNGGNSIVAGTVTLSDNDSGGSLLSLANAVPGSADNGCIRVRYAGSLPSSVRLYGTTGGSGLDQYLDLTITRGVYSPSEPAFDSCTNFQADSTNYIGAGAGVIYTGTLQGFPDNYASGLVDPLAGFPETWTGTEDHVYRFNVTVQSNFAAQTKNATQVFTWEAQNQ